jgi:hypothetical protein
MKPFWMKNEAKALNKLQDIAVYFKDDVTQASQESPFASVRAAAVAKLQEWDEIEQRERTLAYHLFEDQNKMAFAQPTRAADIVPNTAAIIHYDDQFSAPTAMPLTDVPQAIRPLAAEQAAYLVEVHERAIAVGEYTNKATAKRLEVEIALVSRITGEKIWSDSVQGDKPPDATYAATRSVVTGGKADSLAVARLVHYALWKVAELRQ